MPTVFKTLKYIKEALIGNDRLPDSVYFTPCVFMENYVLKVKIPRPRQYNPPWCSMFGCMVLSCLVELKHLETLGVSDSK